MKYFNGGAYYLIIICVISTSFLFYSSNFYPLLSSDDALNILMAYYYKLPSDFYCWGQARGGTLIPLISQLFIRTFHFSALTSVSLSNYLILIIGYIGFSNLFKTNYSKILFGIIWFLPFQRFIDILRFPIGAEYSLIGFAIFFINILKRRNSFNNFKSHLLLIAIIIIFIISVWVSDLAIVTISVLILILFIFDLLKRRRIFINYNILFYFFLGSISCFLFIRFAKSFVIVKTEHYLLINNIDAIKKAIQILKNSYIEVLTFGTKETIVSIYSYCVILFLIIFSAFILNKKLLRALISDKWFTFFISDFIIIFSTFLLSYWVLANGMGRWYFVASYISLSIATIIAIEYVSSHYPIKILKLSLLFIVVLGAISPIYTMKYVGPKTLKPMVKVVGEFKQLGEIGIISEYWNSYITSCPDPGMIITTPNDQTVIKNQKLVDMVFERKNIYVIKDMWLSEFPDTLTQFGYLLLKEGNQFRLGGCDVCKYKKIKLQKVIPLNKFKYSESNKTFDDSLSRNVLFVSSGCNTCQERYFISGPSIPIGIGEFTARFYLRASNFKNDNSIAMLDISADFCTLQLSSKKITKTDFVNEGYNYIDLDFITLKRYNNIEFRIYYYGNADLAFDHLELIEK